MRVKKGPKKSRTKIRPRLKIPDFLFICVSVSHGSSYHLLVYVKPTKGRWWPEKAVCEGGGMVSWKRVRGEREEWDFHTLPPGVWTKSRADERKTAAHRVLQTVVVHVEVGRVRGAADLWDVRGLARQDVLPVDTWRADTGWSRMVQRLIIWKKSIFNQIWM